MSDKDNTPEMPIAVVGIGAIFPGRGDTTGFWRDVFEGRDLLTDVPESHWLIDDYYDSDPVTPDRTYGRRGGFISPVAFDPISFGIPPNALESTDTAQLLALIAARMTLEDAVGDSGGVLDKSRTSVILGVASATELTAHMAGRLQRPVWVNAMRQAGLNEADVQDIAGHISSHYSDWKESTFPGLLGNVVAGRIANRLNLGGSNYVTDAACASSLSALQIALHELRAGDSDTVLTGGVDALNDILMYMCFSKTPALSPTGDCRPFSDQADGTMLGEGVGMLALRRLADAERDGNTIHAVIRGLGGASDGKDTAIYSPLPAGQARAIERAYKQAGYGPETVGLIEAHGTGTKAGDKAELEGLHRVFGKHDSPAPWCAVGSVKSQIGHSKAAAGAASLIKTICALNRAVLPPTIKVDAPAEALLDSNTFYLNTESRPWISARKTPRRASVSSFGFGGSNFHVALEEYTGPSRVKPARVLPSELFLLSATSSAALQGELQALIDEMPDETGFAAYAETSHARFDASAACRAAITASDADDLSLKAGSLLQRIGDASFANAPLKPGCHIDLKPAKPGKIAFLFSGQGSQYVGMGADLAMAFPAARVVWDKAAAHKQVGPLNLHKLAFPPAAFDQIEYGEQSKTLTAMQHAQPAIAAVALSHLALLDRAGLKADMAGGHSFGEIMALHYARVLNTKTALSVAALRGQFMAEAAASSEGAMLAVQTDAETIAPVLKSLGEDLVLANDNGPSQVVLSGPLETIEAAAALCSKQGLKAHTLPVATAFHSAIVASAVAPFAKALSELKLRPPKLPVYANATAKRYPAKATGLAALIAGQIARPVRFREQIEAMYAAGARTFIEVGPGSIVSGLVRDTLGKRPYQTLSLDHKRSNGVTQFLSALGALCVGGHALNLAGLLADTPAPVPKPAPSRHAIQISGANHDKPYPPANGAAGLAPINPETTPTKRLQNTVASPNRTPDMTDRTQPQTAPPTPAQLSPTERIWQELAQRHSDYLAATTAAHTAFMNTASALLGAAPAAPVQAPVLAPSVLQTVPVHAPIPAPVPQAAAAAPISPQALNGHAPVAEPAPAPAPMPDATALVRAIIAEKTGYPEDMLEVDMDLEGELGVDSIKQVEILSTLRERLPGLPEIDPEQLVELRTISAIAAMIDGHQGSPAPTPTPATTAPPVAPAANGAITSDTVRALIAEKTGYPADMLEDDMDLEGELGVDSIKQVEILSALRDQHPHLPEVDPEILADLRTIRKIADFFA